MTEPENLSAYDRLRWSDEELDALLLSDQHRRELHTYFGHHDFERLARLARRCATRKRHLPAPRVYLIPGILGSELGIPRPAPWPTDLLWVDPLDIIAGRLTELRVDASRRVVPLSVLPPTYAALRLELRAAGFDVQTHAYDWRRSIIESGRELAARIAADPAPEIHLVAHSMGGLVARAALAARPELSLRRLILIGTPHAGSFAALQALRGTYPVVRRLAALDRRHDAAELAHGVFSSFASLYEMIPGSAAGCETDFFDGGNWPTDTPALDPELLQAARELPRELARADERFVTIVGVGQRTVTGVQRVGGEFVYAVSGAGDGTVPMHCALLDGTPTYYFRAEHSALPRSPTVARALTEILHKGSTTALQRHSALGHQAPVQVSDTELCREYNEKVDWHALTPEARRIFLQELNKPPPQYRRRAGKAKG